MADKILIIGGGIGGLACALALIRRAIDVVVCEQAYRAEGGRRRHPDRRQWHARAARAGPEGCARTHAVPGVRQAGASCGTRARPGTPSTSARSRMNVTARPHPDAPRRPAGRACRSDPPRGRTPSGSAAASPAWSRTRAASRRLRRTAHRDGALAVGADAIRSTARANPVRPGRLRLRRHRRRARPRADGTGCRRTSRAPRGGQLAWAKRDTTLHYPVRRGELMNIVAFAERGDWQVGVVDRARPPTRDRETTSAAGTRTCTRMLPPHRTSRSNGR